MNREKSFHGRKDKEHSASVRRISTRSYDTSRIKRRITGRVASRRNFARCFGSTAWNTTRNSCLVRCVPPLRGCGRVGATLTQRYRAGLGMCRPYGARARWLGALPALPRWATVCRPLRDWEPALRSGRGASPARMSAFTSPAQFMSKRNTRHDHEPFPFQPMVAALDTERSRAPAFSARMPADLGSMVETGPHANHDDC